MRIYLCAVCIVGEYVLNVGDIVKLRLILHCVIFDQGVGENIRKRDAQL